MWMIGFADRPARYAWPWTTLMENLMDGYVPAHEVSHRDCSPATRTSTT